MSLPPLPPITLGRWRHHKGLDYEVLGVVRHSETLEPLVLYRPLYNDSGTWVRPYSMFLETIEVNGQMKPRFARVEAQAGAPTRRLFIANKNYSSWSLRPWVLLKHLGVPFEEVLLPFGDAAPFRAASPTGKVPCLQSDGLTVWDSLAIVEHLAESVPGVWPASSEARSWARSASAEMHSGFAELRSRCSMNCGLRVQLHEWPPALLQQWQRVDAFFAPVAFRAQTYAPALSATAQAYVQRLLDLPAMRQWYQEALAEPWRDEPHEQDTLALGRVLADERRA